MGNSCCYNHIIPDNISEIIQIPDNISEIIQIHDIKKLQDRISIENFKISYLLLQIYLISKNLDNSNLSNTIIDYKILIIESRKNIIIMNHKIQENDELDNMLHKLDIEIINLQAMLTIE